MATVPRTYITTSKSRLNSIVPKNGQVISLYDADGIYYDAPDDGTPEGTPIRRQVSGIQVVSGLPIISEAHEDILYVNTTDSTLSVVLNGEWYIVASNNDDTKVTTTVSDNKFYLAGSALSTTSNGTLLKNSNIYVQNNMIHADITGNAGTADTATTAQSATIATSAVNDNATTPHAITSYIRGVESDAVSNLGSMLTFTKGDGTTESVRVSDTKYNVFSSSNAGLVNGTNTTVQTDTTGLVLSGSGWIDLADLPLPTVESAIKDGSGQVITTTYVKGGSYNTSTQQLTLTKGDGTALPAISIPNTTYSVFTTSTDGLVPKASGTGTSAKFLRGDGTWQSPEDVIGIYQGSNPGLVPSAGSGNTGKYLKNDGTWGGVFSTTEMGLVPTPSVSSDSYSLKSNGTWTADIDTKNTAGSTNDTSNMIYLVGAREQSSNPQTYSNANVYISGNKLYQSNGSTPVQVVDVSSAQNLENKTFNGNPLGAAAFADTSNSVTPIQQSVTDDFTGDGTTTDFTLTETLTEITSVTIDSVATSAYTIDTVNNAISFTSAPANNSAIKVTYTTPDPTYDSDNLPTNGAVIDYTNTRISAIQTDLSSKLNIGDVADIYDNTATYAVDDFCMYDDGNGAKLYRCITAITVAEDFDSQKWVNMTLISAIKYLIANS